MSSKKNENFRILDIILAVVVLILLLVIGLLVKDRIETQKEARDARYRAEIEAKGDTVNDLIEHEKFYRKYSEDTAVEERIKKSEKQKLAKGEYDAFLISMWPSGSYDGEVFSYYLGLNTMICYDTFDQPKDIGSYFEAALVAGNSVTDIFINIDPFEIINNYFTVHKYEENITPYLQVMQADFWDYMAQYPDVRFHVMVSANPLSYWGEFDDDQLSQLHDIWDTFFMYTSRYDNCTIMSFAMDEWLVANSLNYTDGHLTDEMEQKVFLLEMSDYSHMIDYNNFEEKWNSLLELIQNYNEGVYQKADLSDYDLIFMGDSIFDYTSENSASIPGIVSAFTGASVYNLSIKGTFMTSDETSGLNFTDVAENFMKGTYSCPGKRSGEQAAAYLSADHEGRNTVYLILYGFNDYINNKDLINGSDPYDITTFTGALRTGIETIKNNDETAAIIVVSPLYTDYYQGGNGSNFEDGHYLSEYIEAEEKVCAEEKVTFINAYELSGIDETNSTELLADKVHPTYAGNLMVADMLTDCLNSVVGK